MRMRSHFVPLLIGIYRSTSSRYSWMRLTLLLDFSASY